MKELTVYRHYHCGVMFAKGNSLHYQTPPKREEIRRTKLEGISVVYTGVRAKSRAPKLPLLQWLEFSAKNIAKNSSKKDLNCYNNLSTLEWLLYYLFSIFPLSKSSVCRLLSFHGNFIFHFPDLKNLWRNYSYRARRVSAQICFYGDFNYDSYFDSFSLISVQFIR